MSRYSVYANTLLRLALFVCVRIDASTKYIFAARPKVEIMRLSYFRYFDLSIETIITITVIIILRIISS